MLKPRIIPCLLIQNGGLVKTTKFSNPKYVGDPLNTVKIFNEKEADEIIILDIDATRKNVPPDYDLIKSIARECRMPLCYGGGIKNPEQVEKLVSIGIEKVAISAMAIKDPNIIKESALRVGSQSVVVVLDVKKSGLLKNQTSVFIVNGQKKTKYKLNEFALIAEEYGAGELVINSIDNDGTMNGYDFDLINSIYKKINIPITIIGGAKDYEDIKNVFLRFPHIGCAAGSLFVFKGKYKAVLIQYPSTIEKQRIYSVL